MTILTRRILTAGFVIIALIGIILLIAGFMTQRIRFVTGEEAANSTTLDSNEGISQLLVVDDTQTPSSSSFLVSHDLQTLDTKNNLPPLKENNDFVTKTAETVTITTNRGRIVLELFNQDAPHTVNNFLNLIDEGFYTGLKIHRLDPGFVVQVGDPASREASSSEALASLGSGGPGYRIADEISPTLSHDQAGVVAMANLNVDGSLPNTAGSQFYITLAPATYLDGRYTIFARVTQGLDVVQNLQLGDVIEEIEYL